MIADLPKRLKKSWTRCDAVHVAGYRLHDNGRNLGAPLSKHLPKLIRVIKLQRQCVSCRVSGYPRRGGYAERQRTGTGFNQQTVRVPVVTALEFDQGIATREATRQSDRAHGRLCAGINHAHLIHRRYRLTDALREFCFKGSRGAVAQALGSGFLNNRDNIGVSMSEDHGTPGAHVIDITLPVSAI